MAVDAFGADVLALQRIPGFSIVVEMVGLPDLGAMAGVTLLTKLTLVTLLIIDLLMAGKTGARCFTVIGVLVTFRTLHIDVSSSQWEARRVMIELGFLPTAFLVTTLTLGPQIALVYIVFLVAGIALLRRVAVLRPRHMAFDAIHLRVLSQQVVIAQCMIKLLLIKHRNFCIAPLMIGMTFMTVPRLVLAMKTRLVANIGANFLVALHAKSALRLPVELDMALLAVVFPFHMCLNQLAWRDDRLQPLRP